MPCQNTIDNRIALGVCVRCGKNAPDGKHKSCSLCLENERLNHANRRMKRKATSLCVECGKTTVNIPGIWCPECRSIERNRTSNAKDNDLCSYCRIRSAQHGSGMCSMCLEKKRLRYRALKQKVIDHYGGRCECCGESRHEFLNIDHTNGGGRAHRDKDFGGKSGSIFYRWLIKNGYPSEFRVLCWNCNCSIGLFGYCPHKQAG